MSCALFFVFQKAALVPPCLADHLLAKPVLREQLARRGRGQSSTMRAAPGTCRVEPHPLRWEFARCLLSIHRWPQVRTKRSLSQPAPTPCAAAAVCPKHQECVGMRLVDGCPTLAGATAASHPTRRCRVPATLPPASRLRRRRSRRPRCESRWEPLAARSTRSSAMDGLAGLAGAGQALRKRAPAPPRMNGRRPVRGQLRWPISTTWLLGRSK